MASIYCALKIKFELNHNFPKKLYGTLAHNDAHDDPAKATA